MQQRNLRCSKAKNDLAQRRAVSLSLSLSLSPFLLFSLSSPLSFSPQKRRRRLRIGVDAPINIHNGENACAPWGRPSRIPENRQITKRRATTLVTSTERDRPLELAISLYYPLRESIHSRQRDRPAPLFPSLSFSFSFFLSVYLLFSPPNLVLPLRGLLSFNLVGVVGEGNLGTPDIQRQRLRPPRHRRKSRLMRLYRAETSRISSKRKGLACSKGGGDSRTFLSDRRVSNGNTITTHDCLFPCELTTELTSSLLPTWYDRLPGFLRAKSNGQAACMIIEDYTPTPPTTAKKPRQHPRHQDTIQRFLNLHLVLPKNRTSKFSSNRHRKLQPFRET